MAQVGLIKAGWFAGGLRERALGRKKNPDWKAVISVIGFAYVLPDLVEAFQTPSLLNGPAADHLRHAITDAHQPPLALLAMEDSIRSLRAQGTMAALPELGG